jgi:hypothetical protein
MRGWDIKPMLVPAETYSEVLFDQEINLGDGWQFGKPGRLVVMLGAMERLRCRYRNKYGWPREVLMRWARATKYTSQGPETDFHPAIGKLMDKHGLYGSSVDALTRAFQGYRSDAIWINGIQKYVENMELEQCQAIGEIRRQIGKIDKLRAMFPEMKGAR